MIQALRIAYHSPDLDGDVLVIPLRNWHQFLATKINQSPHALAALAWRIGYLADILLAPMALIGLIIKGFQVPGLISHNRKIMTGLRYQLETARYAGVFAGVGNHVISKAGYVDRVQREFNINGRQIDADYRKIETFVNESVRYLNLQIRHFFQQQEGDLAGQMVAKFTALDPIE